jgi:hypothetical protein
MKRPMFWASATVDNLAASDPTDASGQATATLTAAGKTSLVTVTAVSQGVTASTTLSVTGFACIANDYSSNVTVVRVPGNTVAPTIGVGDGSGWCGARRHGVGDQQGHARGRNLPGRRNAAAHRRSRVSVP